MVSLRVGVMQLYQLHKYALELEQSRGRRGRVEAEAVRGGWRQVEKGEGDRTMTQSIIYNMWNISARCRG